MLLTRETSAPKRAFIHAVIFPILIGLLMLLSYILEKGMHWDFHHAGVYPRRMEGVWGILTVVFVHADLEHLLNNLLSFIILGSLLFYFYREIAGSVLSISYLLSGLILWVIGRESWHIGASGLIYALAFFLFFSGIIRKYAPLLAISFTVVLLYGSMVWHLFPWKLDDHISWEGHLSGGIVGLLLSVCYRKKDPQKPVVIWDEEDEVHVMRCRIIVSKFRYIKRSFQFPKKNHETRLKGE